MPSYQVNEIFHSIQGEGYHVGTPCTFIRLQGCNVGCEWCDTKYTWKAGGERMTAKEIAEQVVFSYVVITGGEPTLYDLDDMIHELHLRGVQCIALETSGQNPLRGNLSPDHVTWSPKPNLRYECHPDLIPFITEVKWVVDDDLDLATVEIMTRRVTPSYVSLMPEGTPPTPEHINKAMAMLFELTKASRLPWRLGARLQQSYGLK